MTPRHIVSRSLRHYWRTNLAVALGVGVAVSALAGALVVGESVRASLRDLALSRLGRADYLVTAPFLFTEQLGERLTAAAAFRANWHSAAPALALDGVVSHERSGSRAGAVQVFAVDDRFWRFHGVDGVGGPTGREAFLSPALADELGAADGDALLLRVQKPSAIPAGVIQGRRDDPAQAVRLMTARVLAHDQLGEFTPRPQQGSVRAIFVPLERLQRDLELPHRVNMLLVAHERQVLDDAEGLEHMVEAETDLADLGIRLRQVRGPALALESDAGLLTDTMAAAATAAAAAIHVEPVPVLTYLATGIRAGDRETPYSLVSALPEEAIVESLDAAAPSTPERPIWLSAWTADDLQARVGDPVTLDYYLWSDEQGLTTGSARFTMAGVLPMSGLATDRDLTPDYPGVSTSSNIIDWDPPFPVDLRRIRPKDEEYWDTYRTAPKAFIRLADGQAIWGSRYGHVTSLRLPADSRDATELHAAYREVLPDQLKATAADMSAVPIRANALAAASGTTDFGEYFAYFSFFLVVASLLLALLFFRLGIEERAEEVGLLSSIGYTPRAIRGLLLAEGAVLAVAGASIGIAGAIAYSALIMIALRTWWVDAVGTTELTLHVSAAPLLIGALAGIAAGLACIAWSLRVLRRSSARQLMAGAWVDADAVATNRPVRLRTAALLAVAAAVIFVGAAAAGGIPPAAGFFGSGTLLLVAGLCALALWLRGSARNPLVGDVGARLRLPVARLGLRSARYRPSRSVLAVALIAAATFLIVAVGAFRRGTEPADDVRSGSGGYALIAETLVPLMHDPASEVGREALGLGPELEGAGIARFRLRPGDDASCLNLYRPQNPRLLGATPAFLEEGRFSFAQTVDASVEEAANPWLLLQRSFPDGAVPVIGDATSLTYVFHLSVGDDYVVQGSDGEPIRLRLVAALRDSILQSELIMSDQQFTRLFPRHEGFRVFLVDVAPARATEAAAALEDQLRDFGMDAQSTEARLASYHRVENTFLSTFQALGGLGVVLGTLGLGTVLLRNVLERRRELALLRATGYRRGHLVVMVVAESLLLLACGLTLGIGCAIVAIAPAFLERGEPFPVATTLGLLAAVLAAGLLSTVMATRVVASSALLPALKNE